ncbi:forkhead box protein N3-like [Cyprinodon tularosa]|uniref:forkhead box protein N3-like n=1 Tax=Cyprinodon tularosa TaxID=77115 RepID=UPI0018E1F9B9|nr:forkhead box protein N3-like [Cyprinodon tularosa]XP_038140982.1 forkhead box protein N3-like [Cyprinodon tularosa]XP_038140984.1 forkhead box protein N3-like [Cyprinodon tularosa]
MGPTMPPSKKAQSPSSGASASQGMSPPYRQGDAATAASEAEAADLSLSVSASFSKAEDEELTSLSWLHESTDLLNSFSHSGLRSVSPLQDPDSQHARSPSSSSPSPDDALLADAHSAYDLAAGANRKPPYSFSCLIFMAIEDAPNKRLPVKDIYGWILEHFPYFANAPTGWKNSVRHNLSLNKCFKKVDKDRSQSIGKGSLWSIDPEYRHNLIQALKKTPYHPYSPSLATPSTSPPTLPPTFHHSPPLWSGSPLFRKNGGVLLQVPRGVIQNGARVRSQALFPVIRPLPVSPVGTRTSAIRSSLGNYLSRGKDSPSRYSPPPCGEDLQEDHTYSTAKSPSRLSSSQGTDPSSPVEDDDIIAVEVQSDVKPEPREIPLDSHIATAAAYISQQPLRGQRRSSAAGAGTLPGSSLPWTKSRARGISDTLPLKKRRALEKPPESDDEEMKEAAGSLLHLAGVRACLNNITNRAAKGQKEQKETLRN